MSKKSLEEIEDANDAVLNGYDPHKWRATKLYDVSYEEVTREQRAKAKVFNFHQLYGKQNSKL